MADNTQRRVIEQYIDELIEFGVKPIEIEQDEGGLKVVGHLAGWKITRCAGMVCWEAQAERNTGIPMEVAIKLVNCWDSEVRAAGTRPGEHNLQRLLSKSHTIDSYWIFTERGLRAFICLICSLLPY